MVPALNTRVDLYRVLEFSLSTNNELPEEADITPRHDFMRIELSLYHDVEKNADQMFLTTTIFYAEDEKAFQQSPYQIKMVSETAISWMNNEFDGDLESKGIIMVIEGLSAALSMSRGVLAQCTALGAVGEFVLPSVDVQSFIEQYLQDEE